MRTWVRVALIALLLLLLAGIGVYAIVWPPPPLAPAPTGAVLDGVTLIEPGTSRRESMRLAVEGERIAAIEPAGMPSSGPYAGMYVLPGLTDMHVHFPPPSLPGQTELFAFLYLYHGVTTVRDAGDTDGQSSAPARSGVREGRFAGPRIFACGPFVDGDPPLWKNSIVVHNAEEGRVAVRTIAEGGFDCVKAYNQLDGESLAAIREEAHARGLKVIGHVPGRVPYEDAKLDDAQHLIGIAPPPADKMMFPLILRQWLALDGMRRQAMIDASLAEHISNTPTLVTIDRLIAQADREAVVREPDAQMLPRFYRDVVWNPQIGFTAARGLAPADFEMIRQAEAVQLATVKRMFDAGVELHTGTDTLIAFVVPGAALHRELGLFVKAGLTPEQALMLSTRISPRFLGVEGLGELRPGAPAELVVFREDPTKSLEALSSIAAVVRGGRLYTRAALDAQLASYRAHYDSPLFDALVNPLVKRVLAASVPKDDHADATPSD